MIWLIYIYNNIDKGVNKMEKLKFRKSEVIAYLEDLVSENAATDEQEELYEEFQWSGKLNKNNYTFKLTVSQMRKLWNEKY